jgi:hypothetical protein
LKYGLVDGVYNGWGGVRKDDCGSGGVKVVAPTSGSGGVLTRSSSKK